VELLWSRLELPASLPDEDLVPVSLLDEALVPVSLPDEAFVPVSLPEEALVPVSLLDEALVPVSLLEEALVPVEVDFLGSAMGPVVRDGFTASFLAVEVPLGLDLTLGLGDLMHRKNTIIN